MQIRNTCIVKASLWINQNWHFESLFLMNLHLIFFIEICLSFLSLINSYTFIATFFSDKLFISILTLTSLLVSDDTFWTAARKQIAIFIFHILLLNITFLLKYNILLKIPIFTSSNSEKRILLIKISLTVVTQLGSL